MSAGGGPGAGLVLGPLLRYADATTATVWVETSAPATVRVLDAEAQTFEVEGHHYALVVVDGLEPGTDRPYDVRLDGRVVWPAAGDERPPPRIRTTRPDVPPEIAFGSCRTVRPHEPPWTHPPEHDPRGVGIDALTTLAVECRSGRRPLPDLLLLLGDQVYADEGLSPTVQERVTARRGDAEPVGEVADFEEYTWLYHEAWSDPDTRWLLATTPSAMIFDDHDVRDDWNTSAAWRAEMVRRPWWRERIVGAYMSYWIYQHLGNVAPTAGIGTEPWADLSPTADNGPVLRRFAERADEEAGEDRVDTTMWSYLRELGGGVRLVVLDTRSGRVLEPAHRSMLSAQEWDAVEEWLTGGCRHLLVASSLPVLLERALHDVESWNEAVCAGAWGRRFRRVGERIRQGVDLEHWAAFRRSFERLVLRLGAVAAGSLGPAPAGVTILSGDVHHSYVAPVTFRDDVPRAPVVQVTASPLRNAFPRMLQRAFRVAESRPFRFVGRALARAARVPAAPVDWHLTSGEIYGNTLGTLRFGDGGTAHAILELAADTPAGPRLQPVHTAPIGSREPG